MKTPYTLLIAELVLVLLVLNACENVFNSNKDETISDLSGSLEPIEEVYMIDGGENATLVVNTHKDDRAYFSIKFTEIEYNEIITNGVKDAWCIDVSKSIDSNNGRYENIKLFSTHLVEQWKPVNYLLNIQQALRNNDPQITWLEIQLAIWSLRAYPKFDLHTTNLENLPGQFREDGQPLFSYEKVDEILAFVEANYRNFNFDQSGVKFAVVAEMPVDVQTVITITEK